MQSKTFAELVSGLGEAIAWFESVGVKVGPTRLSHYERMISEYIGNNEKGIPNTRISHAQFLAIAFEADTFVRLYHEFPRDHIEVLKSKATTILKGPIFQLEETTNGASATARNILYELVFASILHKYGIEVGFEEGYKEDLHFQFDGIKVFCECKRPFSDHGIPRALKDAGGQLKKRFTPGRKHEKGVIAISLDRASNMWHAAPQFASMANAESDLTDYIVQKMRPHLGVVASRRNNKIAGMFCSLYSPISLNGNPGDSHSLNLSACWPFFQTEDENFSLMKRLSEVIHTQIRKSG